jgi:hypothetical protein
MGAKKQGVRRDGCDPYSEPDLNVKKDSTVQSDVERKTLRAWIEKGD